MIPPGDAVSLQKVLRIHKITKQSFRAAPQSHVSAHHHTSSNSSYTPRNKSLHFPFESEILCFRPLHGKRKTGRPTVYPPGARSKSPRFYTRLLNITKPKNSLKVSYLRSRGSRSQRLTSERDPCRAALVSGLARPD